MNRAMRFHRSPFGRFINSSAGRAFRLAAGTVFLAVGLRHRHTAAGKASLFWSILPLSAGGLDICYVSAALGGPLRGAVCRAQART